MTASAPRVSRPEPAAGARPALLPRHRAGVLMMLACTLMWSLAGVVSRQLAQARSFEVTFWRSAVAALCLCVYLLQTRGPRALTSLPRAPRGVWASGLCWAVMFTAFMVAMMLTTVANVLVMSALTPLITAIVSRIALHHRLPARTWATIGVAFAGIVWMFGAGIQATDGSHLLGMSVAAMVPLAAAVNWVLLHHSQNAGEAAGAGHGEPGARARDMLPAVLIGACASSLVTLPLAWPWQATPTDLGWLAFLGLVQLALPCILAVKVASCLPAPEIALLGLLEVVFGVLWAWLGAGEAPGRATLLGGGLVVGALLANEGLGWMASARGPSRA